MLRCNSKKNHKKNKKNRKELKRETYTHFVWPGSERQRVILILIIVKVVRDLRLLKGFNSCGQSRQSKHISDLHGLLNELGWTQKNIQPWHEYFQGFCFQPQMFQPAHSNIHCIWHPYSQRVATLPAGWGLEHMFNECGNFFVTLRSRCRWRKKGPCFFPSIALSILTLAPPAPQIRLPPS